MSVRDAIELSLVSTSDPYSRDIRKEYMRAIPNPVRRWGAFAVDALVAQYPKISERVLLGGYAKQGLRYVGAGAEYTVYRQDNEVIKILRGSVNMNPFEQADLAFRVRDEHKAMAKGLGKFVLPQEIAIDAHPVFPERTVVQARQPFRSFALYHLFEIGRPEINMSQLSAACETYPGLELELWDFIDHSINTYDESRLLPDTNGVGNLVIDLMDGPKPLLIDGQPITPRDLPNQYNILGHLAALDSALDRVA